MKSRPARHYCCLQPLQLCTVRDQCDRAFHRAGPYYLRVVLKSALNLSQWNGGSKDLPIAGQTMTTPIIDTFMRTFLRCYYNLSLPLPPTSSEPLMSTPFHLEVSSLPPLPPILLRHHRHGQSRISIICPLRPAVIHQIQPPPELPSNPQPAFEMEEGLRLFVVDW